jgi:hypothetical protein
MKLIFSDFVITDTNRVSFRDLPEQELGPFMNAFPAQSGIRATVDTSSAASALIPSTPQRS